MRRTFDYDNIYDAIENIDSFYDERDRRVIYTYMKRSRDNGNTPGKVVERGTEWAERFLLAAHPEAGQVITMPLAAWHVEAVAKEIGVHAGERRKEREEKVEAVHAE